MDTRHSSCRMLNLDVPMRDTTYHANSEYIILLKKLLNNGRTPQAYFTQSENLMTEGYCASAGIE